MPVAARSAVVVAFPATRIRRLPARPAPAQTPASALRRPAPVTDRTAVRHGGRAAGVAGVAAMLLALSGAAGWGFVSAERGVQARLAGYATSSAPVAGAVPGMSWVRR